MSEAARLRPVRTLVWQCLRGPGTEIFTLWRDGAGWQLRGTVITVVNDAPLRVRYGVSCGSNWETTSAHVAVGSGVREEGVHLSAEGSSWHDRSGPLPPLQGCRDVDIGITPATNSLPIRRLRLSVGEGTDVSAVWLRFDPLRVERLEQRYTRLDARRYLYESGSGYTTEIEVDEHGLVVQYGDIWTRVAVRNEAS